MLCPLCNHGPAPIDVQMTWWALYYWREDGKTLCEGAKVPARVARCCGVTFYADPAPRFEAWHGLPIPETPFEPLPGGVVWLD